MPSHITHAAVGCQKDIDTIHGIEWTPVTGNTTATAKCSGGTSTSILLALVSQDI